MFQSFKPLWAILTLALAAKFTAAQIGGAYPANTFRDQRLFDINSLFNFTLHPAAASAIKGEQLAALESLFSGGNGAGGPYFGVTNIFQNSSCPTSNCTKCPVCSSCNSVLEPLDPFTLNINQGDCLQTSVSPNCMRTVVAPSGSFTVNFTVPAATTSHPVAKVTIVASCSRTYITYKCSKIDSTVQVSEENVQSVQTGQYYSESDGTVRLLFLLRQNGAGPIQASCSWVSS